MMTRGMRMCGAKVTYFSVPTTTTPLKKVSDMPFPSNYSSPGRVW